MAPQGSFAGAGRTLGASSSSAPQPNQPPQPSQPQGQPAPQFREEDIKSLMDLGVERAEAIQYLQIAGGNVDVAASMLFQG